MSDKAAKLYCGTGKLVKGYKDGPDEIELLLFPRDIEAIEKRFREIENNKFNAVRIRIRQRKEPSPKGHTHYGFIDTWEPGVKGNTPPPAPQPAAGPLDKLPF